LLFAPGAFGLTGGKKDDFFYLYQILAGFTCFRAHKAHNNTFILYYRISQIASILPIGREFFTVCFSGRGRKKQPIPKRVGCLSVECFIAD
jgi:hypothetical protein